MRYWIGFILALVIFSCSGPENVKVSPEYPPVYPDYIGVSIPQNIAPLNFLHRNHPEKLHVSIIGKTDSISVDGEYKVEIPQAKWSQLLSENVNDSLIVKVLVQAKGEWIQYKPFKWHVKSDKVDSFLSYRLIEPGYEVWNKIQIAERNVENFDQRILADNNLTNGSCMNCHIRRVGQPHYWGFPL